MRKIVLALALAAGALGVTAVRLPGALEEPRLRLWLGWRLRLRRELLPLRVWLRLRRRILFQEGDQGVRPLLRLVVPHEADLPLRLLQGIGPGRRFAPAASSFLGIAAGSRRRPLPFWESPPVRAGGLFLFGNRRRFAPAPFSLARAAAGSRRPSLPTRPALASRLYLAVLRAGPSPATIIRSMRRCRSILRGL